MASGQRSDDHEPTTPPPPASVASPQPGPFILRTLLEKVPLAEDGGEHDIKITCVEFLEGNLYVGTSASELLHFVSIPPDPADVAGQPDFILASRLKPTYAEGSLSAGAVKPGVQQILLLPKVGKACILCNSTVTFYSLPELSPVFGTVRVKNCFWIGGIDLNDNGGGGEHQNAGQDILLSLSRKIQLVRVKDDARVLREINFAGSTVSIRRDTIACVAGNKSYALLELDRQLKIPLMTISSLEHSQPGMGQTQNISGNTEGGLIRSVSSASAQPGRLKPNEGHGRSTSLGDFIDRGSRRRPSRAGNGDESDAPPAGTPNRSISPATTDQRSASREDAGRDKALPKPPSGGHSAASSIALPTAPYALKPHIVSPSSEEFLLVTGTAPEDPGIGIFVNLDGDPTRPTVEFSKYPKTVIVDGGGADMSASRQSVGEGGEEGYVIASMDKGFDDGIHQGLEIQRWDAEAGSGHMDSQWLELPRADGRHTPSASTIGLRSLMGSQDTQLQDIVDILCQTRFSTFTQGGEAQPRSSSDSADSRTGASMQHMSKEKELFDEGSPLPDGWEANRCREEAEFAGRFAKTSARVAVWVGDCIWWAVRNPLLLQLDSRIWAALPAQFGDHKSAESRRQLFAILGDIRGRDARSELEFMTFNYIRQRAGVLLFVLYLHSADAPFSEGERKAMEEVVLDSTIDPRVIIGLVPALRNEILETKKGLWIFGGVKTTIEAYLASPRTSGTSETVQDLHHTTLMTLKSYLTASRRREGLVSSANESEIFRTVDACLLLVLLQLDTTSPPGPAGAGSVRAELYELIDKGVHCFDRAVDLLEAHHRLYVLSRLFQSRKQSADVLATWRRIIEGESNDGGDFTDGEQAVRGYLSKLSNKTLVQEYGIWLAKRNPKLGVQVFADDKSRAPRFEPTQAVKLLRQEAPSAVKYYLEHLVFDKGHTSYVNELINYYLDIVLQDLASTAAAREAVATTYTTYRALGAPKPTYRQFLQDNAPADDEAWQSRLRLLQLLGEAHNYDAKAVRDRIESAVLDNKAAPLARELLVPEAIILDGREGQHEKALRLLVQQLGDYDTAVSYCLRGGSSIYAPTIYRSTTLQPTSENEATAPREVTLEAQSRLFRALLGEFLALQDINDRIEQTSALLERFGRWFDMMEVLSLIPEGWSVDHVSPFLVAALRKIVSEKHETTVASKLSSAENLKVNVQFLDSIDEKGPVMETDQSGQEPGATTPLVS